MVKHIKNVYLAIDKLTKAQALKALELTFNEKGIKDMYAYYAIGGISDYDNSQDAKIETAGYLKFIKEAKKLVK